MRLQYWDSGLYIEFMQRPVDPSAAPHAERMPILQALVAHVDRAEVQLVASTFLRAEVRTFSTDASVAGRNDPDVERQVRELFDGDRIEWISLTPRIADRAQAIGLAHNELTPADCVHIATAEHAGVDVLFTYDGASHPLRRNPSAMLTYSTQFNGLRIEVPFDPWPTLNL